MISIQNFGIQAAAAAVAIVFNQNPTPRATRKFMAEQKKNVVVSCRSRVSIDPFPQPNVV